MMCLITALSAGTLDAVGVVETRFRLALLLVGSVLTGWLAIPRGSSPMVRPSRKRGKVDGRESSFPSFTPVPTGDRFPRRRARSQCTVAFAPLIAAFCSQSQSAKRTDRAISPLNWDTSSAGVHWRPSLAAVIVTHLVTRTSGFLHMPQCPRASMADRRLCHRRWTVKVALTSNPASEYWPW